MNILLVNPEFPTTYWGMQHALSIIGKRATLPPLGLITVAAILPQEWEFRLVDRNIEPLQDADLRWADVVLVGGMHIQEPSIHDTISRANALERPTIVGGPAPTTLPDHYGDARVRFLGEAEGRATELIAAIRAPRAGTVIDARNDKPELSKAPLPRYDLIRRSQYRTMSLQYSRGCPFRCEFCDIIEIFGRRPRVKTQERVLCELESLYRLGYRGPLFFVDDNFIGNKPAVKRLLPYLSRWQRQRGYPFDLYTEASLNLAEDTELMDGMVAAGFTSVFLGLESPLTASLQGAAKTQNLRRDMKEAVDIITEHGFEVMGGFIVGFDQDDDSVFAAQRHFIQSSPIAIAMVGLLTALPETALARRLAQERRLRRKSNGDSFGRPNFEPAMDEVRLLRGYAQLLADLFDPNAYYARCTRILETDAPAVKRDLQWRDIAVLLRTFYYIGLKSPRRRHYWRLLARALRTSRHRFARAVAHSVQGEHLIRYTQEVVLPRIEESIAEIERERSLSAQPPRESSLPRPKDKLVGVAGQHGFAPRVQPPADNCSNSSCSSANLSNVSSEPRSRTSR